MQLLTEGMRKRKHERRRSALRRIVVQDPSDHEERILVRQIEAHDAAPLLHHRAERRLTGLGRIDVREVVICILTFVAAALSLDGRSGAVRDGGHAELRGSGDMDGGTYSGGQFASEND